MENPYSSSGKSRKPLLTVTYGDWMKTFLRYEATRATPLKDDSHMGTTQSCRLHSGQIALWGSVGAEEPLRIHLFNKDGTDTGNALRTTCDHNYDIHLLSIIISSRNYLAVSCRTCGNIRLKNLNQFFEEPTEAFKQDKMAGPMCTGPDGIMYMACRGNGEILVLDCTKLSFVCKHLINPYTPIDPNQICFVSLHDIFVLGSTVDRKLCAVTRNGHKFWEIDAVQNQGDFNPEGLVYLPNHDLLLVGDLEARKIYILASKYGLCMNVLTADKEVENVHALHLGDNHVIARCRTTSGCVKLYFYKNDGIASDEQQVSRILGRTWQRAADVTWHLPHKGCSKACAILPILITLSGLYIIFCHLHFNLIPL